MTRDLMTLQDKVNRMFGDLGFLPRLQSEKDDAIFSGSWAPAVDIYENENEIVLKADLPDIETKDLDIRIEDNILYLRGERKFEKEVKEQNFHRVERAYGSFARSFALPNTIHADKINADYKNGVLKLTLPKREETKPKQIKINVN
jgi:HSP20 family protein